MALHGPHHGAQKSTSSGTSLLVACASKLSAFSATGCPPNNGDPQWPHLPPAPAASFSRGARFRVLQAGQATIRLSVMAHLDVDLKECHGSDYVALTAINAFCAARCGRR